jgi:hypothetical protein
MVWFKAQVKDSRDLSPLLTTASRYGTWAQGPSFNALFTDWKLNGCKQLNVLRSILGSLRDLWSVHNNSLHLLYRSLMATKHAVFPPTELSLCPMSSRCKCSDCIRLFHQLRGSGLSIYYFFQENYLLITRYVTFFKINDLLFSRRTL